MPEIIDESVAVDVNTEQSGEVVENGSAERCSTAARYGFASALLLLSLAGLGSSSVPLGAEVLTLTNERYRSLSSFYGVRVGAAGIFIGLPMLLSLYYLQVKFNERAQQQSYSPSSRCIASILFHGLMIMSVISGYGIAAIANGHTDYQSFSDAGLSGFVGEGPAMLILMLVMCCCVSLNKCGVFGSCFDLNQQISSDSCLGRLFSLPQSQLANREPDLEQGNRYGALSSAYRGY